MSAPFGDLGGLRTTEPSGNRWRVRKHRGTWSVQQYFEDQDALWWEIHGSYSTWAEAFEVARIHAYQMIAR